MLFSKFSKWKRDRGRAASLIRGGADSGSHRSFASTRRRSVHRGRFILRAPFLLSAQFRGGSCQKSGGFHQLGKRAWEEGAPPRSCGVVDLALYLRSLAASKCERREAPSEGPSVDENLPISGRSPQFFCHGSSRRCHLHERARVSSRAPPRRRVHVKPHAVKGRQVVPARKPQHAPGYATSITFVKTVIFSLYFCHDKIREHIRDCSRQPRADHLCAGARSGNKQQRACPIRQTWTYREGRTRALPAWTMGVRAERHVRLGGHVGRTRCPALRRIRHRRARSCPHKPDSHVRGNSSSNAAKSSG